MYGFQSYISVPILLPNGSFFGTLCCGAWSGGAGTGGRKPSPSGRARHARGLCRFRSPCSRRHAALDQISQASYSAPLSSDRCRSATGNPACRNDGEREQCIENCRGAVFRANLLVGLIRVCPGTTRHPLAREYVAHQRGDRSARRGILSSRAYYCLLCCISRSRRAAHDRSQAPRS